MEETRMKAASLLCTVSTAIVALLLSYPGMVMAVGKDGQACAKTVGKCSASANNCCDSQRLLGIIAPSDACFGDFISPMTNPVNFEDPRTLTEARFIFLNHRIPAAVGGDGLQLFALQVRAALNDRLSIIATKDGYIVSQNPVVGDGWADVAAGLKLNLYSDPCAGQLLSTGATYEMPVGSPDAFQGNGDGEFHMFLTAGTRIEKWHWIGGTGIRLPANSDESSMMYWSNHLDRQLGDSSLYALFEFNWYHWIGSGNAGLPGVEGLDVINLGSTGVAGNNISTGAFGFKYSPSSTMEVGVAWEVPFTERRDIIDNRLTVDWIVRY
jgi:hypothetical protein